MPDLFTQLITGLLVILSFGKYSLSFHPLELALLAFSFIMLESKVTNISILYSTFFAFEFCNCSYQAFLPFCVLFSPINTLLLFGYDFSTECRKLFSLLLHPSTDLLRILGILFACLFFQVVWFKGAVNFKRKLFHIAGLFIFIKLPYELFDLAQLLIFFFVCLSPTKWPYLLFSSFLSSKDYGNVILSHIYLLAAFVYPFYFLDRHSYLCSLLAVGIMDAAASICGKMFKKHDKSIIGMIAGIMCAILFEQILANKITIVYHFIMAVVEYSITDLNDNILLPIISVIYFNYCSQSS